MNEKFYEQLKNAFILNEFYFVKDADLKLWEIL